jgi:hypothetical protein
MARIYTTPFNETDCIGDCYGPINNSLGSLDNAVQSLLAYDNVIKQAIDINTVTNNLTANGSITTNEIQANIIRNTSGQDLFINGYPRRPGQVIETLTGLCDGSQITVGTGTYTMPNVTSIQEINITRVDVTGSLINYTPPPGTTRVKYEFEPVFGFWDADPIGHFSLFIDDVEAVWSRVTHRTAGSNPAHRMKYTWIIPIGGTDLTSTSGRQSSWTTPKQLKLRARSYTASFRFRLHSLTYWDGSGNSTLQPPFLTITSIA